MQSAGWAILIVGIHLALFALLGPWLGIGIAVYGTRHILALIVGVAMIGGGAYLAWPGAGSRLESLAKAIRPIRGAEIASRDPE